MTRTIERLGFLHDLLSNLATKPVEYQRTAFDRGFAEGLRVGYEQAARQVEIELEAIKVMTAQEVK